MKKHLARFAVWMLVVTGIMSGVGCYPVYPPGYGYAYNQDSKGYAPPEPVPQRPPVAYAVDPGLAIAGVAAAGLLGYAIGNNHGYHHHAYYGGGYYAPRCY